MVVIGYWYIDVTNMKTDWALDYIKFEMSVYEHDDLFMDYLLINYANILQHNFHMESCLCSFVVSLGTRTQGPSSLYLVLLFLFWLLLSLQVVF